MQFTNDQTMMMFERPLKRLFREATGLPYSELFDDDDEHKDGLKLDIACDPPVSLEVVSRHFPYTTEIPFTEYPDNVAELIDELSRRLPSVLVALAHTSKCPEKLKNYLPGFNGDVRVWYLYEVDAMMPELYQANKLYLEEKGKDFNSDATKAAYDILVDMTAKAEEKSIMARAREANEAARNTNGIRFKVVRV